jgi:hypothetical protein
MPLSPFTLNASRGDATTSFKIVTFRVWRRPQGGEIGTEERRGITIGRKIGKKDKKGIKIKIKIKIKNMNKIPRGER